jgi:hypothetical protein
MTSQAELFTGGISDADAITLRGWLLAHGWATRRQIAEHLGWAERKVPAVAELLGSDIVRGQRGFKLTEKVTREDLPAVKQAVDAGLSQGKKQIRYALALKRKLHQLIG